MSPAGKIYWFIDNDNLTDDATQTIETNAAKYLDVTSKLRFYASREINGYTIRCEIHHELLPGRNYLQDEDKLNVVCTFMVSVLSFVHCITSAFVHVF